MKKNPKYIASVYHKDETSANAKDLWFNWDDGNEDMTKSEIESYIHSKWSNLIIKDIYKA